MILSRWQSHWHISSIISSAWQKYSLLWGRTVPWNSCLFRFDSFQLNLVIYTFSFLQMSLHHFLWAHPLSIYPLHSGSKPPTQYERRNSNITESHTVPSPFRHLHLPCSTSSASSPLHSSLNRLAPVRLPSPPITHRLVMPFSTRWCAALRRPSCERNSLQRALPMTVPPCGGPGCYMSSYVDTGAIMNIT